jgi:hypothetical protein
MRLRSRNIRSPRPRPPAAVRGRGRRRGRNVANRRENNNNNNDDDDDDNRPIYCGNNRFHPSITNQNDGESTHRLGTPAECLQKGFFLGSRQPVDPSYRGEYEPLYRRRIWCGENPLTDEELNGRNLDMNGSLVECFRKGFGGGKSQRARRGRGRGRGRRRA